MVEGIAEHYWGLLVNSEVPSRVLTQFFSAVFDITPSKEVYGIMGKLVRLYGRRQVFMAILELTKVKNFNPKESFYGLLNHILMQKLKKEDDSGFQSKDLQSDIERITREIEEVREANK